jgi:hypothetical protein
LDKEAKNSTRILNSKERLRKSDHVVALPQHLTSMNVLLLSPSSRGTCVKALFLTHLLERCADSGQVDLLDPAPLGQIFVVLASDIGRCSICIISV